MTDHASRPANITYDEDAARVAEAMYAEALATGPLTHLPHALPESQVRATAPRWRRLVTRIMRKAPAWRRRRGRTKFQRLLLDQAKRLLKQAAWDVRRLISDLRHHDDQPDQIPGWADFRRALAEIGDSEAWETFLQVQGLEGSRAAESAVANLAEHVAAVTKDRISEDSLQVLILSIETFLAEIEALDARVVRPERAEFLKATAVRISVQVAAASAAISASAGAGGSDLTPRMIMAGLAGCVASEVVSALHDGRVQASRQRGPSEGALLVQAHEDLVEQLETLELFVRDAAPGEAVPRCDDQMALRVHLQARFLLMYAQLLLAGRGRDLSRYRDELGEVRELLDDIGCLIERNEGADAVAIAFKLRAILETLPAYRTLIESF